jgi:hypothetical protein
MWIGFPTGQWQTRRRSRIIPTDAALNVRVARFYLCLTVIHNVCKGRFMKKHLASITKRLVAAMLVITAVVGVSALAMQAPTQNLNSVARSLKNIQTDKATLFYASQHTSQTWFVELALPGTSESKATTSNLRVIATTL